MEILPSSYFESLKRYWRRRRYQRLNGSHKKKLKVSRLGVGRRRSTSHLPLKNRTSNLKLRLRVFASPIKYLVKFHDAYVDMMIRLASNPKGRQIPVLSCGGEEVDGKVVLEIYKRMASTREVPAL